MTRNEKKVEGINENAECNYHKVEASATANVGCDLHVNWNGCISDLCSSYLVLIMSLATLIIINHLTFCFDFILSSLSLQVLRRKLSLSPSRLVPSKFFLRSKLLRMHSMIIFVLFLSFSLEMGQIKTKDKMEFSHKMDAAVSKEKYTNNIFPNNSNRFL